jgi:hypothetical protein
VDCERTSKAERCWPKRDGFCPPHSSLNPALEFGQFEDWLTLLTNSVLYSFVGVQALCEAPARSGEFVAFLLAAASTL